MDPKLKSDTLKAEGNEKYKAFQYEEAIRLYKQAAALQPTIPVYLSNLSAAQLEFGQYKESFESCQKALSLISEETSPDVNLRAKIVSRRSKLLLLLYADDPTIFDHIKASDTADAGEVFKAAAGRRQTAYLAGNTVNNRIASMPRYRHSLQNTIEQFTVGHDIPNSILRAQLNDQEMYGPVHPWAKPFHMQVPRDGRDFDFSAIFIGAGDARHLFVTLVDLAEDLESVPVEKSTQNIKAHFCLNDIHPNTLARDMIILTACDEISRIPHAKRSAEPRVQELFLMMHYVYWGTTMPPAAHDALQKQLQIVYGMVQVAVCDGSPLDLGWLYVDSKTVRFILPSLKLWIDEGPAFVTFEQMLPPRLNSDPRPPPFSDPRREREIKQRREEEQQKQIKQLRSKMKTDTAFRISLSKKAKERGMTVDQYFERTYGMSEEDTEMLENVPEGAVVERKVFRHLKFMVPPPHANEPNEVETVFQKIRDCKDTPSERDLQAAHDNVKKRWFPNYTMLDKKWAQMVPPRLTHCPFQGVMAMIPTYNEKKRPTMFNGGLYPWSEVAFGLVADAMTRLRERENASLTIEVVLDDGYAFLDAIRLKAAPNRKSKFPVQFDRIHGSNVPDYIGGHFVNFTSGLPLLKPHSAAYVTSCSLLNAGSWEGKFMVEFDKILDSSLWTYAGVTRGEVQPVYGANLSCTPSYPGNYHSFRRIERVSKEDQLKRAQLMVVLYSMFWKTVLPVKMGNYQDPMVIREPQNVHAFFRLLETLKRLGYQTHVLADVVESILENKVTNRFPPHDVAPIPLATHQTAPCVVCTTPFAADFEVAATLWEPRLFPISSAAMPAVESLERYSVKLERTIITWDDGLAPTTPLLQLVFGLPKDLDGGVIDVRKKIVGTRDCRTSLQFVSTCHYDHDTKVATVLLARSRMAQFRKEGYEVALLNTAFWRAHSGKVKCSQMILVGDVDGWDRKHPIKEAKTRELTQRETYGFVEDMMSTMNKPKGGMGDQGVMGMAMAQMMAASG